MKARDLILSASPDHDEVWLTDYNGNMIRAAFVPNPRRSPTDPYPEALGLSNGRRLHLSHFSNPNWSFDLSLPYSSMEMLRDFVQARTGIHCGDPDSRYAYLRRYVEF